MTEKRNAAVARLIEYGKAAATKAEYDQHRDQWIWDAYREDVSKAEIARLSGVSWATVDRAVRDMQAAVLGGKDEEG